MEYKKIIIILIFIMPSWAYGEELNNQNIISVCYNYSCKQKAQVDLAGSEWAETVELFSDKTQSSLNERKKISKAIALMEQLTGRRLGTSNDKAKNSGTGEPGQMDCIDESRNTTAYLKLFEENGWIKWHQTQDRAVRSPYFFNAHWTAVIKDNESNQMYAIDSWFRENGKEPVILTLEEWMARKERP
ncbi:MAG: hypothetical protein KZQ85_08425 [Candidatus Thiodiazotropha sp. (ex Myrtea sp. 'scaly one' KF741663)]|nr:hypothetical protein [Candidatus Thiodiazotropha sp. (ex Myrtea sp. 'scaly one' KF741663)]